MDSRRIAVAVFAALCLGLSGLVLHRQIAAHPAPSEAALRGGLDRRSDALEFGLPVDRNTWHLAAWPRRRQVLYTIQQQLSALRHSETDKVMFYQTRSSRSPNHAAAGSGRTIFHFYPEIGHARSVQFGALWMDSTEQYADVTMTARSESGRLVRGDYQLLLEDGIYRVASIQGER